MRPRAPHEVPLLTVTASRVIEMEDTTESSGSSGTPTEEHVQDGLSSKIPPVGNPVVTEVVPEPDLGKEVAAMGALVNKRRRKRSNDEVDANAPPKVLRKDHDAPRPTQSTLGRKFVASMGLEAGFTFSALTSQESLADVSDPDPLSYAKPQPHPEQDVAQSSKKTAIAEDPDSENSTSFTSMGGSPGSIYQPGWGVTNNFRLDTPNVCQDMVDHIVPPGGQTAKERRDQRIQAREKEIKNLKALLEAEADMKEAVEAKNAKLVKELGSLHVQFSDLQVSNNQLSQQVTTLRAQVTGKERIKAAFKEFKKYGDDRVNSRCAKMDARLDALSIDFDEELYPHMLTAIADLIMASLYLESDSGEDAPQWIRELRPSSSQLKIPVYPEVRDPKDPWSFKEEILLEDAITANISHAEKKCWVVRRTHGVGSAQHARSDGVPVSVPTVVPHDLAILLADAATQNKISKDEASPRLLRSKSLPPMYNLDWP
ncbi:hypothetical protein Tco_0077598 [Tanacetum coccineum]